MTRHQRRSLRKRLGNATGLEWRVLGHQTGIFTAHIPATVTGGIVLNKAFDMAVNRSWRRSNPNALVTNHITPAAIEEIREHNTIITEAAYAHHKTL